MSREIDAQVAERIFGWTNVAPDCYVHDGRDWCGTDPSGAGGYYGSGRKIVPHYSTDVARAWEVVEKLSATHRPCVQQVGTHWQCSLEARDGKLRFPIEFAHDGDAFANAETASMAICLAALEVALGTRPAQGGAG